MMRVSAFRSWVLMKNRPGEVVAPQPQKQKPVGVGSGAMVER
jgi:hypothetical protein